MEKRTFYRANVNANITINTNNRIFNGRLENISMGGLYTRIEALESIKEKDIALITIPLPVKAKKECIVVTGEVTRTTENGIACRFLETDADTLRALFYLVYRSDIDN